MVLINSLKTTTWKNIKDTSLLAVFKNLSQDQLLLFKYHLTMDSEMKLIPLVMSMILFPRSQKLISSNMQTTTKRFLDTLLGSIPRFQKMLTEDSSSHSISQMTLSQSLNQLRRTPVSSRVHSQREESIRTSTSKCNSSPQQICPQEVTSRSMVTTSTSLIVMSTLLSTLLPIPTSEQTINERMPVSLHLKFFETITKGIYFDHKKTLKMKFAVVSNSQK